MIEKVASTICLGSYCLLSNAPFYRAQAGFELGIHDLQVPGFRLLPLYQPTYCDYLYRSSYDRNLPYKSDFFLAITVPKKAFNDKLMDPPSGQLTSRRHVP
jgi:hypothetical protein